MRIAGTKLLSKNTEDLHGSPRWATKADIAETNLMQTMQGVYVGGWHEQSTKRLHYLRHNGPEHILAFAPIRSGKGVGIVIRTQGFPSGTCSTETLTNHRRDVRNKPTILEPRYTEALTSPGGPGNVHRV